MGREQIEGGMTIENERPVENNRKETRKYERQQALSEIKRNKHHHHTQGSKLGTTYDTHTGSSIRTQLMATTRATMRHSKKRLHPR